MNVPAQLLLWWLLFGGTHLLGSALPVRTRLTRSLGLRGFKAAYSLVSFATFGPLVWVLWHGRHAGPALYAPVPWLIHVAEALMLLALVFLLQGLLTLNPLSTAAELSGKTTRRPRGIQRITRHPLNTGFALFGVAHCLTNPYGGDWIFYGGFVLFALVSAAHQDRRLLATDPAAFAPFLEQTSLLPFAAILSRRQTLELRELRPWGLLAAVALFALLRWAHPHVVGGFASG